jgi:hypothetical protein
MTQAEWTSFSRIVEHIRQLCSQRKTGTLFLASDENLMVQVHLDSGNIVSLMHRNRRGLHALAALTQIRNARLRFDDGYVASSENHDLSTQAILDHLENAAPKAAESSMAPGASASNVITAEVRATAQKILMRYVGPMAEIICADHFERATDLRALARALADEIPDQEEAAKFAVEIRKALNLTPA